MAMVEHKRRDGEDRTQYFWVHTMPTISPDFARLKAPHWAANSAWMLWRAACNTLCFSWMPLRVSGLSFLWSCRWLWPHLRTCFVSSCLQLTVSDRASACWSLTLAAFRANFFSSFWSLSSYQKSPLFSSVTVASLAFLAANSSTFLPQASSEDQEPLNQVYHSNAPLLGISLLE